MTVFGALRSPRTVLFGGGQREMLGRCVAERGSHVLVCTDGRLAGDSEFNRLMDGIRAAGTRITVNADVQPDAPTALVAAAAAQARRAGVDVIVGIGGGSCVDVAKAAALVATHGGRVADYYGEHAVPGPTLPVIAVPTTAGTGSEVTPVAVLSDPERAIKAGISSPFLVPDAAICDPELTYGCPPALTASAGIDALSHGIESFTAIRRAPSPTAAADRVFVGKNSLADPYGLRAISLVSTYLRRACVNGDDVTAREQLMVAALAGGYALGSAGTAAAHALQYPVGALTHTPHGVGIGVLLPYVMEFNRPARVPEFVAIARAMGIGSTDHGDDELAAAAIDAVAKLCADVGIPRTLADLGLQDGRIGWAAEQAMTAIRLVENNPRPLDAVAMTMLAAAAHRGDRAHLAC